MSDWANQLETLYQCLDFNMKSAMRESTLGEVGADRYPELTGPGIYFVFEPNELRACGGDRVVRVGIADNLKYRLKQHLAGSSNFLNLVFAALSHREQHDEFYAFRNKAWREIPEPHNSEMRKFNERVICYMKRFRLTWIPIPELRQRIRLELWATVLLSNYWYQGADRFDPPSNQWLGYSLPRGVQKADEERNEKIRRSGLWSAELVDLDLISGCQLEFRRLVCP